MDMHLRTNANSLAAAWMKRSKALIPYLAKATEDNTKLVHSESKRAMTELIYDKPIPSREQVQKERMGGQQAKGRKTFFGKSGGFRGTRGVEYKAYTKSSGGKPAWKRTGNLRRSEKFRIAKPTLGIVTNDANYAKARHDKKKTRYPAPWRKVGIERSRKRVVERYQKAFVDAHKAGVVSMTLR